jgi:hypothetical protein
MEGASSLEFFYCILFISRLNSKYALLPLNSKEIIPKEKKWQWHEKYT